MIDSEVEVQVSVAAYCFATMISIRPLTRTGLGDDWVTGATLGPPFMQFLTLEIEETDLV